MPTERDRTIRDLAYRLWDEDGRPEGQSERYWLQAEGTVAASGAGAEPAPESIAPRAAKAGKGEAAVGKSVSGKGNGPKEAAGKGAQVGKPAASAGKKADPKKSGPKKNARQ